MLNFFDQDDDEAIVLDRYRVVPSPYSTPRPMTAAAERLKLSDDVRERVDKRKTTAWQTAAWQFFDQVGEVKFAFSLIGQVISRVRIYAAYVQDPDSAPVEITELLRRFKDDDDSTDHRTRKACEDAQKVLEDLNANSFNGVSSLMREAAINLSVPGEFYLVQHKGKWHCASSDELLQGGTGGYKLKRDRTNGSVEEDIEKNAFVARIWRAHPRFSNEPDSSMLGVLDQCEQLVLLDQAMRVITRSRLNAGALFVPDGVGATDLEQAISDAATGPLDDESAMTTVVPLLLRGPAEMGKEIKLIDLSRRVDADMLEQQSRALDRVLAGLDIPKDIVAGLSQVRYSNAVIITDELFRSHIEPLVLLLVDALTSVLMQPTLKKEGVDEDIARNVVFWYDPSDIVTRPDQSQAANDGFDRNVVSGKAWRQSRGFTEMDAPTPEELLLRLATEKTTIPPEIGTALLELIDPNFFKRQRAEGQEASGMPADVASMLDPNAPQPEPAADEGPADDLGGGDISQGGFMPPKQQAP